jgi:hypothetical protein
MGPSLAGLHDDAAAPPPFSPRRPAMWIKPPRSLLLFTVLLAACGSDRSDTADRAAAPAPAPPGPAAAGPAAEDSLAEAHAPRALRLSSGGLEVPIGNGPQLLPFGTGRARVLADLSGMLGEPREQGTMEECPSGPLSQVSYDAGLQLSFRDTAFVGWFAEEGSSLRAGAGIGSGSTLGQLRAAYPTTTLQETSLGYEFDAGGLYGIVTDTTADGRVQVLFAGTSCIFR